MELEKAIRRLEILLKDDCQCSECLKNKEAYKTVLKFLEDKNKKQIYYLLERRSK